MSETKLEDTIREGLAAKGLTLSNDQIDTLITIIAGEEETPEDKLGGLLDHELQVLVDYNRREARIWQELADSETGEQREKSLGLAQWLRDRARHFQEWAAIESREQDEYENKRNAPTG
jgi:hypothetical protein